MGLFSRKTQETQIDNDEMHRQLYGSSLVDSLGTSNLDELLRLCAPMHEQRLKNVEQKQDMILANQQRIIEELDAIRHAYQTPEHAAAQPYFKQNAR